MRLLGRGANIKAAGGFLPETGKEWVDEKVEASWEARACQVGGGLELMKDAVVREAVSLSHMLTGLQPGDAPSERRQAEIEPKAETPISLSRASWLPQVPFPNPFCDKGSLLPGDTMGFDLTAEIK